MTDNPENIPSPTQQNDPQTKPLDTVVSTLIKNQSKTKFQIRDGKTYDALFKDIKEVLSEFDTSIGDCKKYNEARIHRKYQIRISDLQNEIKMLKQKLKQQQSARSPSKKYIQQLVDQLVYYKNQNQKLSAQNQKLIKIKHQFQEKYQPNRLQASPLGIIPSAKQVSPIKMSARDTNILDTSEIQLNLKNQVQSFLKQQKQLRKVTELPKSKLQIFLKKNIENCSQWTFIQFLTQIDKWISKSNHIQQKALERLRSNVMSTFEDQIEKKKLPKLASPYSLPKSSPYTFLNATQLRRMKNKDAHKSKKNYSTIEVIEKVRQKYTLK